ncbi:HxlR family transcriptional regulator [Paenibacillus taichungensis]|nr:HxlR family transcriptional regulator [Paenibacillus taichungensis]
MLYRNLIVTIGGDNVVISKKELPLCPVATTVGLIGNKWKLLVMRDLLKGTQRFGELRKSIPEISQKVLTENLRSMEEDGIVIRTVFAEVPPRVEYSLSDLGNSLKPIIFSMETWGLGYQKLNDELPDDIHQSE